MTKGSIFVYAVLHHPKDQKSELVVKPTPIVATSEQNAKVLASRELPTDLVDKLDEVEIVVRPF